MTRFEFYSNLNKYYDVNTLKHSNGRDFGYYTKIDKYYPDGSARYFYTKDQWDAYQKGLELQKKAKIHNQQVQNYENNKKAEEAQNKQKQDSSTVAMRKEHPEWFNSKNAYVEPVKDILGELNFGKDNRISNTWIVDYCYKMRNDGTKVNDSLKKHRDEEIDKIYNKEDAAKMKELLDNIAEDQDNIIDYMKNAGDDDYYKNKLKPDNMHKMLADAINRQQVDDRKFRSEDDAIEYALGQIEDYIQHVWYDFMEKDAKAKDYYNKYVHNSVQYGDEFNFRGRLLKKLKAEVKKEIIQSFPEEVAKKYLPKDEDFWKYYS